MYWRDEQVRLFDCVSFKTSVNRFGSYVLFYVPFYFYWFCVEACGKKTAEPLQGEVRDRATCGRRRYSARPSIPAEKPTQRLQPRARSRLRDGILLSARDVHCPRNRSRPLRRAHRHGNGPSQAVHAARIVLVKLHKGEKGRKHLSGNHQYKQKRQTS